MLKGEEVMDGHYKSRKEICVDTMMQYHLDFLEFLKSGFEVEKDDPKTSARLEFEL